MNFPLRTRVDWFIQHRRTACKMHAWVLCWRIGPIEISGSLESRALEHTLIQLGPEKTFCPCCRAFFFYDFIDLEIRRWRIEYLRDPVFPLIIIIIVFLFYFGCAIPNEVLDIMKLVSTLFLINQTIYGVNAKRINNGSQYQIDNYDHCYKRHFP